jgi:hypothetical protein
MDALPTRRGRPRRTRDMAEIYAYICGRAVDKEARVLDSDSAIRCVFEGCKTSWCTVDINIRAINTYLRLGSSLEAGTVRTM